MSLESIKARNLRAFASTYRSRVVSILILPTVLSLTGIKCPSIERAVIFVLFVTGGMYAAATFHAKAVVLGICLIFRN